MYQMSSQSGKRGDGLSAVQRIHTVTSQIQNLRQSFCRGVHILLIRNILRCRTYQQIAMDSRSYKDTFTHFRGLLEIVEFTRSPQFLSIRRYSPLRGTMRIFSSQIIL